MRRAFKRSIKRNLAILIEDEKMRNGKLLYDVSYQGETYRVVYDTSTNNIVTVLSKEYYEPVSQR